ncbi:MAG: cytochrome bd-I oxidase subunit CydX [Sulfuriferula sp.]|nr:cytochrome bd-I oxidase subunit CydX [Sulfuriferula sp.]
MWYFAWILGVAMAVLLAIVNAVYGENHELREAESGEQDR